MVLYNPITDHGQLGDLADDDHTQYLLVNGTRVMTADLGWDADGKGLKDAGGTQRIAVNQTAPHIELTGCLSTHTLRVGTTSAPIPSYAVGYFAKDVDLIAVSVVSFSDTAGRGGGLHLAKARGSQASPDAVQTGDRLGWFLGTGYDGSNWQNPCGFNFYVDAAPSAGSVPARVDIETGTGTGTRTMRFRADYLGNCFIPGKLRIGSAVVPTYAVDVVGDVNVAAANTYRVGGTAGVSGSFTTVDGKTVTVTKGIITSIV